MNAVVRCVRSVCFASMLIGAVGSVAHAQRTISIPTNIAAEPGQEITVSVLIDDGVGIAAGRAVVFFDAAVFSYVQNSVQLPQSCSAAVNSNMPGRLVISVACLSALQAGPREFARFRLLTDPNAPCNTVSTITLDAGLTYIADVSGNVPSTVQNGSALIVCQVDDTPTSTPIPTDTPEPTATATEIPARWIYIPDDLTAQPGSQVIVPVYVENGDDVVAGRVQINFNNFVFSPNVVSGPAACSLAVNDTIAGSLIVSFGCTSEYSGPDAELFYVVFDVDIDADCNGTFPMDLDASTTYLSSQSGDLPVLLDGGAVTILCPTETPEPTATPTEIPSRNVYIPTDLAAVAGGSVVVPVRVEDGSDVTAGRVVVYYPSSIFSFVPNSVVAPNDCTLAVNSNTPGVLIISFGCTEEYPAGDTELVHFTLDVSPNAECPEAYTLGLDAVLTNLSSLDGDLPVTVSDGLVSVACRPTDTPVPTDTPEPTATDTAVPPTDTPVPTDTPEPTATPTEIEPRIIYIPTDLTAVAGGSVVVPVRVNDGSGAASGRVVIYYDASVFEPGAVEAPSGCALAVNDMTPGVLIISFGCLSDYPAGDAQLLSFVMNVSPDASCPVGYDLELDAELTNLSSVDGDIPVTVSNGMVTVSCRPTDTPVPTDTPEPTATDTPRPTNTPTATDTPLPPTATPTNTPTNTAVPPTDTPTATDTPLPPTATPTNTPTNTAVPPTNTPTATDTPLPPTATPTNTPTNTPVEIACEPDVDRNCVVNVVDLQLVVDDIGQLLSGPTDTTNDGVVDVFDLYCVATNFGLTIPNCVPPVPTGFAAGELPVTLYGYTYPTDVGVGETFSYIVETLDGGALRAYQFDVSYDASKLELVDISQGDLLKAGGARTWSNLWVDASTPGEVNNIAMIRLEASSANSDGVVAELTFVRTAPGDAPVSLNDVVLIDVNAQPLPVVVE